MSLYDFKTYKLLRDAVPHVTTTASKDSIGVDLAAVAGTLSTPTWGAANLAIYVPFTLRAAGIAYRIGVYGATASGNADVGIYDLAGTRLVSMGSTAITWASSVQKFNITDTVLAPGRYFMALAISNSTATHYAWARTEGELYGVMQQTSAFPLPATATFASPGGGGVNIPHMGVTLQSVALS